MGRLTTIVGLTCSVAATLEPNASLEAQTRDTVILRSGYAVIGEVKSLGRGSLSFDTDEMDVVSIDWDDIAFVRSPFFFEVELSSGAEYFGSLASADTAQLVVVGAQRSDTLEFRDVVVLQAFESSFFARTNGFIDLGTNIARANSLASILLKGQFNYRGPKWGLGVSGDFYRQRQTSVGTAGDTTVQRTSRSSGNFTGNRFIGAKWAGSAAVQAEQNDELNLDLRFLALLGGQFRFVRNQGIELYAGGGGTLNTEKFVDEAHTTTPEILVYGTLDVFDVGDIDVYTSATTYTSFKDGGRFRLDIDGRIAWEIFSDFNVGLSITERIDTRPPSVDAAKRDFQYSFTIGWSWS
jgi:hypothetical protein